MTQAESISTVYVLGHPQTGGCWLWNDNFYTTYNEALSVLKDKYEMNGKIFLLHRTTYRQALPNKVD